MPNPFAAINDALTGKKRQRQAEGAGVKRAKTNEDDELRRRRNEERLARARAQRLKELGIK